MQKNINDHKSGSTDKIKSALASQVAIKAARKLKSRGNAHQRVWFGLGMMGLIGWSVTIPTLIGASIGVYLDVHYPSERSWTLALLVGGLAIGCFNAWHWIEKEDLAIREEQTTNQKEDD
ncbi:AtpZ/AtpI family protein [Pseudocolwellia sp. HL-MZ7]|uniref:AtpZ/AtpI family protein n=1 Tax=Pseudocolwellia sp. HL-MZ7 TaxID=3400627 RepID=UPI003CEA8D56